MNQKTAALLDHAALFCCPVCRGVLTPAGSSLVCPSGHTFDVSRKGHVNFVPSQKPLKYTGELFEARGRIFAANFYDPLLQMVRQCIERHRAATGKDSLTVTDAGCGQGFYSKALADENTTVLGFDLSADAIAQAAAGPHQAIFFVGDLTNIPLADASCDIILDILTQANYSEFHRILKPGGILLKVIPGEEYLKEIRQLLGDDFQRTAQADSAVTAYFAGHFAQWQETALSYRLPLDPSQARDFLKMTPLTFHIDTQTLDVTHLTEISIHLKLLLGTALPVREVAQ